MVARFLAFLALPVACASLVGCSLILDPETCGGDGDCAAGRTCQSGICIGPGTAQPEPEPDAAPQPDGEPEPDAGQPEPEPDAMVEPEADMADMAIEPDMAPAKAPPTCEITVPATAEVGPLSVESIEIRGIVTDGDTPGDQLVVTLAGAAVALMPDGSFTAQVPVAEGPNTIRLEARDPDMQTCNAQVRVRVDRSAPQIVIQQPNNDLVVNPARNPFRVSGTYNDASNVTALRAESNGSPIPDVIFDGGQFSFQVQLVNGDNLISVIAEDEAGNVAEAVERLIELDSVPPDVTIEAPADGTRTAEATIQVSGLVSTDGVGESLSNLRLTVNGADVDLRGQRAEGDGSFTVTAPLDVGDNRIVVFGDDLAGNDGEAEVSVIRDDPAPCVAIEGPEDGSFINQDSVMLTGTVCPAVDRVEIQVGDGAPVAGEVIGGRFEGTAALGRGPNPITVRAFNPESQAAQAQITVNYDNTPPTVRLNQPVQGACLNDEVIRVCGIAEDFDSGINQVQVQELDSRQAVIAELVEADFCADLELDDTASARLVVNVTNNAGATARFPAVGANYTVRIDRTEPDVVIQNGAVRPWLGIDAFREVTLRGTADGGICPPVNATWARICDGEVPLDANCAAAANPVGLQMGRFTIRSQFPDGERAIRVRVTDEAGNERVSAYNFRVDSVAPVIVSRTEDQFTPEAQIELCVNATDPASGVNLIRIDNVATQLAQAGAERRGCHTVDLDEGPNSFEVRVEDLVGNVILDDIVITRDTTPPIVAVTWPAAGGGVAVPTNVEGTAVDGVNGSGVAGVSVTSAGRQIVADFDPELGTWRATRVPVDPEAPILMITATDANGNERTIEHAIAVPPFVDLGPQDGFDADSEASRLFLFDASGDGRPDVLSLTDRITGASALYIQRQDGTFGARDPGDVGLPDSPTLAADLADVNNDGEFDLVLSIAGATRLFLGDGEGGFAETPAGLPNIVANGLTLGDLNADGNIDLVLLAGLGSRVQFGDGQGTFNSQNLGDLGLNGIGDFTRLIAVDFTGDARLDLILMSELSSAHYVFGGGRFSVDPAFVNAGAAGAVALDADRDGDLDLFTGGAGAGRFVTNEGKGYGQTLLGVDFGEGDAGIAAGDLDGDTFTDVVVFGGGGLRAYLGGAEGFEAVDLGFPALVEVTAVEIADLDRDGDLDIIYTSRDHTGVIRSNLRALDGGLSFTRLTIQRGAPGPIDAKGAIIRHEYAPGMVRLLPALPGVPTVVSLLGGDVEVLVDFIGGGSRTVPALVPDPEPIIAPPRN